MIKDKKTGPFITLNYKAEGLCNKSAMSNAASSAPDYYHPLLVLI